MTLSEAIRLGAMLKPQQIHDGSLSDGTGTCALGAAMEACGIDVEGDDNYWSLGERFPHLDGPSPEHCAHCGSNPGNLMGHIWHLNDTHYVSREKIADWVATLEAKAVSQ